MSDEENSGVFSRRKDYERRVPVATIPLPNIFYSKVDGGYIADIPDLKYCSAFGETPEDAVREVMTAKAAWLGAARDAGKSIPRPRYRPAIYQLAS